MALVPGEARGLLSSFSSSHRCVPAPATSLLQSLTAVSQKTPIKLGGGSGPIAPSQDDAAPRAHSATNRGHKATCLVTVG
jgi:hypothetical protein